MILVMILLVLLLLCIGMVASMFYFLFLEPGAIFYPSKDEAVKRMLRLAGVGKKDVVVDLGSGDGRILIAAAKKGARAVGYEINPGLVKLSRRAIKKAGLEHLAEVRFKSFWHADFNEATVITLYLFPNFMNRLQNLLEKRLTHPLKLVSNIYRFKKKSAQTEDKGVFLYQFGTGNCKKL